MREEQRRKKPAGRPAERSGGRDVVLAAQRQPMIAEAKASSERLAAIERELEEPERWDGMS